MLTLTLKQYLSKLPYSVSPSGDIYGGAYRIPKGSLFYTEILLDNDIDFTSFETSMEFINSHDGRRIIGRAFRFQYYKPLKKWFKNRKIKNNKLFFFMLTHMTIYDNYLRDMSSSAVDPEEIIKFFKSNEMY